ncbi:hypothetical protein [Hyphomonas sp.]|jgi:hypothetical protein|uniref:hypothetical protein n=1 Tax=Alphaproteobacteria TaxID=28211 RepID=UPI002EC02974|nr:hypothetical protein [Pseudomonadota bacterium]
MAHDKCSSLQEPLGNSIAVLAKLQSDLGTLRHTIFGRLMKDIGPLQTSSTLSEYRSSFPLSGHSPKKQYSQFYDTSS